MSCGIDFGTSNSALGYVEGGAVRLLPVEGAAVTLPSVMFFNEEEKSIKFGRAATADYINGQPGRFMRALKSILGSSLAEERTQVNGRAMPFVDIIAAFLRHLRTQAGTARKRELQQVVLGRPVYFVDDSPAADARAQQQLEDAARKAGFTDIAFQFEPIAAALDYEQQVTREELVLIADIGAGTSDFSVIRVGPQQRLRADRREDILANGGVHLGGNDFDRLLSLDQVMPSFGYRSLTKRGLALPNSYFIDLATWHKIHFLYTPRVWRDIEDMRYEAQKPELLSRYLDVLEHKTGHEVAYAVEYAKIALSAAPHGMIDLHAVSDSLSVDVRRDRFEHVSEEALVAILGALEQTLKAAGVTAEQIHTLVFTGGAAQMPLLRARLLAALPHSKVADTDAFSSVASGLAVAAARHFG